MDKPAKYALEAKPADWVVMFEISWESELLANGTAVLTDSQGRPLARQRVFDGAK